MDLAPARWIWWPSQRTLANSFVLFRRAVSLPRRPARCAGWILADSRYRLSVNGRRVAEGPAPSDPREPEVDPVDLTAFLDAGENVLGVEVLHFGQGEGTWPAGKPGLLLRLELELPDGSTRTIVSDEGWRCLLDRSRPPGRVRRWYLRSLQEITDLRLFPHGWDMPGFAPDARWRPAMALEGAADKPPVCTAYWDYAGDTRATDVASCRLRERSIAPMRDVPVRPARCYGPTRIEWRGDPDDWFDTRTPGLFEAPPAGAPRAWGAPVVLDAGASAASLLVEFPEGLVGYPHVEIDAAEGTIVELMWHEGHDPAAPAWLDTQFCNWSRFICREGLNVLAPFEFEAFRWLQVHLRDARRPAVLRDAWARRRVYAWPHEARILVDEPPLQRLMDAAVNTLRNCAQETLVDGMARERQQYSGDCGHQLHALRYAFGEARQPARFIRTFARGITREGYFLDAWPAFDRLNRLAQRQVDLTAWGPILDHGVQFAFDAHDHWLYGGDLAPAAEAMPALLRFAGWLESLRGGELLPVEEVGVPSVWIDHEAYARQRHKQCAFNLHVAAMYGRAIAPLCRALGDAASAERWGEASGALLEATVGAFWCRERRAFVNNLPWMEQEGAARFCDRSLAMGVLFEQCPGGDAEAALRLLAEMPPEVGRSYPANAGWRLHALARGGRASVVWQDLRTRWAAMNSVVLNHTIGEFWHSPADGRAQWSHCGVAPLNVLMMDLLGFRPVRPGFSEYRVEPRLGDVAGLDVTARSPAGALRVTADARRLVVTAPAGGRGALRCDGREWALTPGQSLEIARPAEA